MISRKIGILKLDKFLEIECPTLLTSSLASLLIGSFKTGHRSHCILISPRTDNKEADILAKR
uniref:Uncharacterized protein n=1 Tax=Megaselia scalaris TaxID=36166 RepID=T1H294_MEGSC